MLESMRRDAAMQDIEANDRRPGSEPFHDDEDDPDGLLYNGSVDDRTSPDPALLSPEVGPSSNASPVMERAHLQWMDGGGNRRAGEDEDVPESLLLAPRGKAPGSRPVSQGQSVPRTTAEAQWKAAQEQQGLHSVQPVRQPRRTSGRSRSAAAAAPSTQPNPRVEAMWLYTNANNLDAFLLEVYQYYVDHGVWSVLLSKTIELLTQLFVFSFAMFLTTCIDYSKIPVSKSTTEIMIPKCMSKASWIKNAAVFFFVIWWLFRLASLVRSTRRLFKMHDFYLHVLGINDQDIQTVSWVRVVDGLVKVRNANVATANHSLPVKKYLTEQARYEQPQQRLTAEGIANRLMRQDNYYVAMYNKDLLDFTLPVPFLGSRHFYSKSLEWAIDFCLTNFIFDEQGSIRPFCLDVKNRAVLVDALRRRLRFAALTSVVLAPFNILRNCIVYFFRYYTEFTRNPSRVSARSFTPYAEWKVREFNELDHLFQRRLRQAYPFANDYLKQFPKNKTDQVCRFIAFISGAFAAVLTLATLFDSQLFLTFQVTPGRTAVFWLTVMIGIFGVAHGSLPDETEVHDPVLHLKEVLMFTHYMPAHWKDRLHSNEVRAEFSSLYQMKILIFLEEVLSFVVAPLVLWRNSGKQCERIIDFFREHTVHIEGIGYQCNFAVFGFKKDLNAEDPTAVLQEPDGLRDDYYGLKDDKMAASVQNFMQYYSHYNHRQGNRRPQGWQPPPAWPPMLSPPAIAEAQEFHPTAARPSSANRTIGVRQSALLNARRRTSPGVIRSPQQMARSGRHMMKQSEATVTESRQMAEDSELDDYDKALGRDPLESDTDGEDGGKVPGGNAGVLGMLYQFSKAQTDKGTGVNI